MDKLYVWADQMRHFDNRELQRRVDEVLYYIWDPIGVSDEPYARAEYESYVPHILKLLETNESIQPISEYLGHIVANSMGLTPNKRHNDVCAELLLQHKEAIKEGCA